MRVSVEILASRFFYIAMEDDATVADLKWKIVEQEKLPFDRLILLLCHSNGIITIMTGDEVYLQNYGVGDGSLVYLFFNNPAGNDDDSTEMWLNHDYEL